jgi:hypothetical protein
MPKVKDSSIPVFAFLFVLLLGAALLPLASYSSTCTGSDPCNACKNCKYCKHCAKASGKCGVCKNLAGLG